MNASILDPGPLLEGCDPWTCTDRAGGEHSDACRPEERRERHLSRRPDGSLMDMDVLNRFAPAVTYGAQITGAAR